MIRPRHDAKYSAEVLEILRALAGDLPGPIVDPFAGVGLIDTIGRADVIGIELEPEWAEASPVVRQGDALQAACYPEKVGAIVTSPTYGNRMGDPYLGPRCRICDGFGTLTLGVADGTWTIQEREQGWRTCTRCEGLGRVRRGRYGYGISLGRLASEGSSCHLQWGDAYREFHRRWLIVASTVLDPGPRRLVLNMSDHYRGGQLQYVCHWWIEEAGRQGFRLADTHRADTARQGHGQNGEKRAAAEMVFVFDLIGRSWA